MQVEAQAAGHRADFERERDRAERFVAELLKATADTMAAKESTARLEGELAALRSRPWWKGWWGRKFTALALLAFGWLAMLVLESAKHPSGSGQRLTFY